MVSRRHTPERGIALLATLLALALMSLLVIEFTTASRLGYRAAANQANQLRAEYLARSGVQVGIAILGASAVASRLSKTPVDTLMAPWAQPFPPVPVNGGVVTLGIVDDARKLDINQIVIARTGLVNPVFAAILQRLFTEIDVPTTIIPALVDWVDPDSITSPDGGAEADFYLRLRPPYVPRNGPMPTIGDLRLVRGVTEPIFMRLTQYLTAMPETRVNVNTASPEVLAALSPDLYNDPATVKEIIAARAEKPFVQITDMFNLPGMPQNAVNTMGNLLTTHSNYFTITAGGSYAGTRRMVVATFRRDLNATAMLTGWHEE